MKKIFFGFLLIMLQFKVPYTGQIFIGYSSYFVIDFFPTFIGYILLIYGLKSLSHENTRFKSMIPFAMTMAIFTGFEFFLSAFGILPTFGYSLFINILEIFYQFFTFIMMLVISYQVVKAIQQMEKKHKMNFNGRGMMAVWIATIFLNIFAIIPGILLGFAEVFAFANLYKVTILLWILMILAGLTVNILFLVSLYLSQKRYSNFRLERKRQIQKRYAELSAAAEQNDKSKELDIDKKGADYEIVK